MTKDLRPKEKFIGFATNMQLKDSELYSKRWGIETGYRMMGEARARTRSTKTVSRIFCFLYSVVMFNAWMMNKRDALPCPNLSKRQGNA